jgi:3-methyladenine DNA glycosylase/8-oxoguanine DNA glycosylase
VEAGRLAGVTQADVRTVRRVRLPLTPPYAVGPALASLAAHAVPGIETVDLAGARVTRTLPAAGGPAVVTVHLAQTHADVALDLAHPDDESEVVTLVRRWLDLDADPVTVAGHLGGDRRLAPLLRVRPGLRVLGHVDGFEAAVTTVLGQQVSLAAARTFAGRLVAAFGTPLPEEPLRDAPAREGPLRGGFRAFPRPHALADAGPGAVREAVGVTGARARTVHALATACADGLAIAPDGDDGELRRRLLALPGIGPWTVDYLALRVLGDRDALPAGDLVLRRALGMTAREVVTVAEAWRPVRAYAVTHLWTASAY